MASHPRDLDALRVLLDSRSSVYKLSTEPRGELVMSIKQDSGGHLRDWRESHDSNTHFYSGKSGGDIEYGWLIATVSGDFGRLASATAHDYFLVFFDHDLQIVGWKENIYQDASNDTAGK